MSKRNPDPKLQALRQRGTLNAHPERVVDELFLKHDFFDPNDLVQVKYEMLRRVEIDRRPLTESAEAFGFSRPSFYSARAAFEQEGLPGLIPRRRGPKSAHKLTDRVMDFIEQAIAKDESLRARALVPLIEERFNVRVHPRSIERALARRKKKRR